jgi:hypothetical protein
VARLAKPAIVTPSYVDSGGNRGSRCPPVV